MFRRHRLHRPLTAFCAIVALLFAQVAMAQYACPAQADPRAMAAMSESDMSCEGMDTAQPALCHQHAADAAQSFEVLKVPTPSLPAVIQVLVLAPVREAANADRIVRLASVESRPPPDPLFLSTLRLRV